MTIRAGDYVVPRSGDGRYAVVRVEEWGDRVLVVRDATGEYPPSHTFKVRASTMRKETIPYGN